MITFQELSGITGGNIFSDRADEEIKYLITDSRRSFFAREALFFAIPGKRHDGHDYLSSAYKQGIRQFVVQYKPDLTSFPESNFLVVDDVVGALQAIAAHHRAQYQLKTIGITGSNGKTIIKEWLYQMLIPYRKIVKSPHSYNSQIGVPLSVWQINKEHEIGIFEAGISTTGEMKKVAGIIQPELGIFTNIGSAHDEGFTSTEEKVTEKALLFEKAKKVVYCKDVEIIDRALSHKGFTWGYSSEADLVIEDLKLYDSFSVVHLKCKDQSENLSIPFVYKASVENCMHCVATMKLLGFSFYEIQEGLNKLQSISMRLEMKRAINGCSIIDDTYNNDFAGLQIALEFVSHQKQQLKKTVILSDIQQSGVPEKELYQQVNSLFNAAGIQKLIGIGDQLSSNSDCFDIPAAFFVDTEEFLKNYDMSEFQNELILVKGARSFMFERLVKTLEERIHGTQLEINLDALTNNLNFYKSKLKAETKLMVMVKAFAYGSGSLEVANFLQFHRIDYLGVAYPDEGFYLRQHGIYLPIMVMNTSEDSFDTILKYDLEPEIYNFNILQKYITHLNGRVSPIHLKLDTGMHRLGFEEQDLDKLINLLQAHPNLQVRSIFSHLAGADEERHNDYSYDQATKLKEWSDRIKKALNIEVIIHLLNSPGIVRFPDLQFDMVRLGIGLYGLETNNQEQEKLQPIGKLKTIISQIKTLHNGETVGYGRHGKIDGEKRIATIAIGYADGFSRAFSKGVGEVWINGEKAPVVGNVCMDMTMVDVTNIPAQEGDEVEVFGEHLTISEVAQKINTIPYEILTNVSQRVKRTYYVE
ncbi:bifunctional UDP-N-acetylmuramoyl-tripeptide:D-alanyl-D-alanine ligase/alanine racemase [Fulvivirga ligni]|uniref:bifunctional UDP-N-acetylmuramoyl-tripeptide:D-alanyl-D-alanine ligase/alanine racemase n=1 Tax=Fulvivirga ligni TaxID=2904246 RepID=UPI001F3CB403|nr:bifunctional UDP-N-acetylmuramoyl-tripeptide:D-alanyl-D-alanine ligase/alanine racemase [Fulvivirga ligni]UII22517.1 bifunctional UDP-N-acetylmuramoyl-tripeptide:D-alanyl-D-alanine ligase/alanine racemase [Fulvivirga ligni]